MQENYFVAAVEEGVSLCKKFIIYFLDQNNFSRENLEDIITCTYHYLFLATSLQEKNSNFILFQTSLKNKICENWPSVENSYVLLNKKKRFSPEIKQQLWKIREQIL